MNKHRMTTVVALTAFIFVLFFPSIAQGTNYGAGSYGSCQYESCSISLASNTSVSVNVTPTGTSTTCSVSSDTVGVSTGSSTGYTLSFKNVAASSQMTGNHGGVINPIGSTPTSLTANTWGYRVDGLGTFGSGPTTSHTNSSIPTVTFAAVPASGSSAATLRTVATSITSPDATTVWYGLCANTSIPAGTYSSDVIYTAVVN